MRHLFSVFSFFFLLEQILAKNTTIMKLLKTSKEKRHTTDSTPEQIRNLQNDFVNSYESDEQNYFSNETTLEKRNATEEDTKVDPNIPVSTKGQLNNKKNARVQIMKFHSFKAENKKINFGTFFYFYKKSIPYKVTFRLRITYNSRLRNLQKNQADCAKSECVITDPQIVGKSSNDGININYNCSAKPTGDANKAKIELNTDFDLVLEDDKGKNEILDFNHISFTGNADVESKNINENKQILNGQTQTLKDAIISKNNHILKIFGTLDSSNTLRSLSLNNNDKISMELNNTINEKSSIINYDCILKAVSVPSYELNCDTSKIPINTSVQQLHLSSGNSPDGTLLIVNMKNGLTNTTRLLTFSEEENTHKGKSSSKGLSAGAIAGIVIACVVVVSAITVVIIMLKKSSPAVNTLNVISMTSESDYKN